MEASSVSSSQLYRRLISSRFQRALLLSAAERQAEQTCVTARERYAIWCTEEEDLKQDVVAESVVVRVFLDVFQVTGHQLFSSIVCLIAVAFWGRCKTLPNNPGFFSGC